VKVGDLVRYRSDLATDWPFGVVVEFDNEGDPLIWFPDDDGNHYAYFKQDMEVVSERR
jgi:hypothetical protein